MRNNVSMKPALIKGYQVTSMLEGEVKCVTFIKFSSISARYRMCSDCSCGPHPQEDFEEMTIQMKILPQLNEY